MYLNDHLFGQELFIRFILRVLSKRLSVCECACFLLFQGGMWDMIVSAFRYTLRSKDKTCFFSCFIVYLHFPVGYVNFN